MKRTKTKKLKVAVTGNIGSGKTTFVKFLAEKGYPVIQADDVSKDILANDPDVKEKIIDTFGADAFVGTKINKTYLSKQIFSDSKKLKKINSILHPLVREKIESISKNYFLTNNIVFVEVALVYESKIESMFDFIVLITSDKDLRIKRVIESNKMSEKDFNNRNNNQLDDKDKIMKADFTFSNNGSLEDLKAKADLLTSILNSFIN